MSLHELSMSPAERLRETVANAFPACDELRSLTLDPYIHLAWKQLASAAGVDQWALAKVIAGKLELRVASGLASPELFALQLLPERLASEYLILPLRVQGGTLAVATACPFESDALSRVRMVTDRKLELLVAPPEEIETALVSAYSRAGELQGGMIGTLQWTGEGEPLADTLTEQSAVVRLARSMLLNAIEARASDLHLQPWAGGGMVRIRVDGILHRLAFIPGPVLDAIARYFKANGGMDPTNDRAPQDGRMSLILGNREYDLRLSVLPASRGERLVIRFLDQSRVYRLSGAGFSVAALQTMRRLASSSAGVVLLTGPTGSGKTSTLYSMLAEINRVGVNIITVENPVEYRVTGLSQVEVNPKAGLTFASALRSILRQDPDVLLIGEIRDSETADIAMQAALTGHLVLSTLHTNDALTAIPRLLDLGVQPSVLADAVVGIVAQRLLRRLCTACRIRADEPLLPEERLFQEISGERPAWRAVGCAACNGSGYSGRLPVTEIVEMTPDLGRSIADGHRDLNTLQGFCGGPLSSLAVTAAHRIISGDTTAGEAFRVIGARFWSDVAAHFKRALPTGQVIVISGGEESAALGASVLLVQKSAAERQAIAAALDAKNFNVHATDDPAEARRLLEKREDVVLALIDLDPGQGGDSVAWLKQLREAIAWSRLPVVLIVAADDNALRDVLAERGVLDYLAKPVTADAVAARVGAVLSR